MITETTVIQYGCGSSGMRGLTFNEKRLNRWARSLHISSMVKKNLLHLKEASTSRDVNHYKEKGHSWIIRNKEDREKIRNFLPTSRHPFNSENHPGEIVRKIEKKCETFCQPVHTLLMLKITQQKLWTCTPVNYQKMI